MKVIVLGLSLVLLACAAVGARAAAAAEKGAPAAAEKLILLQGQRLAAARARLAQKDPALQPALAALRREADRALQAGPFSVMDKTFTPPGGDKHDYLSHGPYWWPDPAKKDGLPYINRDGVVNPDSRTSATDSGRKSQMLTAVNTLAVAYYFTDDEKYAARAALLLRTWFLDPATRMNPNLTYAQTNPGHPKVTGTGIIDTVGLPELADSITLLGASPALTPRDRAGLQDWFGKLLDWLLTSEKGKLEAAAKNNHGMWYDAQVASYALFVGRPEVTRQIAEAARKRIAAHVEPDGRLPQELRRTKSFHYTLYDLRAMMTLAAAASHAGVDLWHFTTPDGRGIRKAAEYLFQYADPAKKWPDKEISKYSPQDLYGPMLEAGLVYNDESWLKTAAGLAGEARKTDRTRLLLNQ